MRIIFLVLVIFSLPSVVRCQLLDLFSAEYTYVPGDNSNFEYKRSRILFNYPFQVNDGAYLFVGMDYSHVNLDIKDEVASFNQEEADNYTILDFNLTYTIPVDKEWRFAVQLTPGLSSNFERSVEWEDFVYSGIIVFVKDKKDGVAGNKPYRIFLGVSYSGSSGVLFPIPFARYYRRFHPKWSYNLGVPVSNIQYRASERLRFKLFASLDGFNANLQRDQETSQGDVNGIRLNMILAGTRYEYKFSDHIECFLTITRSFDSVMELRKDRNRVLSIPVNNVMHYRIGIRGKI
ncbi:MAG: DUF6268 family outer membrane beta-barrel protein [Bacteroidota bacterium]